MEQEIENRKINLRPKLHQELAEARAFGDLSENDEYRQAKRRFRQNENRIVYLEKMIRTAKIISADSAPDEVGLFDSIEILYLDTNETETIRLATTTRLDALGGIYSKDSPLGKSIFGHKVGEKLKVSISPNNFYFVEIKKITKGEDDDSIPLNEY